MASDVLELEDRRWEALIANDLDAIEELFHPQLTYTHSNAMVDTKESYISNLVNGVVRYLAVDREDVQFTEIGDTAVITGAAEFTVEAGGRQISINSRFSSVWVREGGRWQFFVWHNTPFP